MRVEYLNGSRTSSNLNLLDSQNDGEVCPAVHHIGSHDVDVMYQGKDLGCVKKGPQEPVVEYDQ
eukprot:scaffold4609_cov323-Prasinococcus_capsulatus_cf.AAC.2